MTDIPHDRPEQLQQIQGGGQTYEIEFRGEHKSHHVHSVILWHMGIR